MKKFFIVGFVIGSIALATGCSVNLNIDENLLGDAPVIIEKSRADAIKQLFVDKYGKNPAEVVITITEEDATHAKGGVKMGDGIGAGGSFLAAKTEDVWKLVFDGNGNYFCEDLASYDFPASMIKDCTSRAEMETSANIQMLRSAFAKKFNHDIKEIEVNITKSSNNTFFKGNVRMGTGIGSAGMFLAIKDLVKKEMNIVVSGSGTYTCAEVTAYNFPADMITDCSR